MSKRIVIFRAILATGAGVLTLFFSINLFSQVEKGGDFWRDKGEARKICQKEIGFQRGDLPFLKKNLRKFFHPDDRTFESAYHQSVKNFSGETSIWTPLGPEGGWVTSMAMHPSNSQILYASFYRGGDPVPIYKTTNGGANWQEISTIERSSVYFLTIDPSNPDTIYAGTNGYLYKSTDGGINWSYSQIKGLYSLFIEKLLFDKDNSNIICGGGGYWNSSQGKRISVFFKTTDGGANWDTTEFDCSATGPSYFMDLTMDSSCDNLFFTYYHYSYPDTPYYIPHLHKSTDGGASWLDTNYADTISNCQLIYSIVFNPNTTDIVYAATHWGLYISTNGGASWGRTPYSLTASTYKVAIDSTDANRIWCGGWMEIYRTTDGGANWIYLGGADGLYGEYYEYLLIGHSSPSTIYTGNYSGVFKSTDQGNNWSPINNGIYSTLIDHIAINPHALYVWVAGDACYRSTDGGVSFERRDHPIGCSYANDLAVNPQNPSVLFAAGG